MMDKDSVSIPEVLSIVGANTKGRVSGKGEIKVLCPLYSAKPHYLEVNLSNGFRCWKMCSGCPVNGKGGAVNLYRLFNPGLSFSEAAKELADWKEPNPERKKKPKPAHILTAPQQPQKYLRAAAQERDKTYRAFLAKLTLSEEHRKNLLDRGLDEKAIEMFRSIPACGVVSIPKELLEEGCQLEGVPLFGRIRGVWSLCLKAQKTGFYIPYFDEAGRISQLQIRYDVNLDDDKDAKNQRYRWASSAGYQNGTGAMNIPFWGCQPHVGDTVYLTEGGLKAIVASRISGKKFVAIPGVTCFEAVRQIFEKCKGCTVINGFDMDGKVLPDEEIISKDDSRIKLKAPNGNVREIKTSVYNALTKIAEIAKEMGVVYENFFWNPEEKGIDDYFLAERIRGHNLELPIVPEDETIPAAGPIVIPVPAATLVNTPMIPVVPLFEKTATAESDSCADHQQSTAPFIPNIPLKAQ